MSWLVFPPLVQLMIERGVLKSLDHYFCPALPLLVTFSDNPSLLLCPFDELTLLTFVSVPNGKSCSEDCFVVGLIAGYHTCFPSLDF